MIACIFLYGIVYSSVSTALAVTMFGTDVPEDAWFYDAVMSLKQQGVIEGYPDGTFCPNEYVNRAELAVILDRLTLLDDLENACVYENKIYFERDEVWKADYETGECWGGEVLTITLDPVLYPVLDEQ